MVETGLERLLVDPPDDLRGARLGLLMNQASIDRNFRYACDVIDQAFPDQLACLFSPQHGLWCQQQANMDETEDGEYPFLDLPIHSLYSQTRRPTARSLAGIDCLVIDLQDVGTRVYTFIWTVLECLRACQETQTRVVVLDRPNPLGGRVVEGPILSPDHVSFVGGHPMPMRHAMTVGEIARWLNAEGGSSEGAPIGADLTVIAMRNWNRGMSFFETGLPWVPPSPNMPTLTTAMVYPGQVLLEGTNLSEGRGTTQPFEICGAPFLDGRRLIDDVQKHQHEGVVMQPIEFLPTFDKWSGQTCGGVAIRIVDQRRLRSFRLTLSIIDAAITQAPDHFAWLDPPYEYEWKKPPIDILYGNARLRTRLDRHEPLQSQELDDLADMDSADMDQQRWRESTRPFHLYPD